MFVPAPLGARLPDGPPGAALLPPQLLRVPLHPAREGHFHGGPGAAEPVRRPSGVPGRREHRSRVGVVVSLSVAAALRRRPRHAGAGCVRTRLVTQPSASFLSVCSEPNVSLCRDDFLVVSLKRKARVELKKKEISFVVTISHFY